MKASSQCGIMDGQFALKKVIGSGGTSKVFLAQPLGDTNPNIQGDVAVKVLNWKNNLMPEGEIKMLNAEYETMSQLHNPNIIQIYKTGRGDLIEGSKIKKDVPYMVLEIAEKGDLFEYVACPEREGFEEPYSRAIFKQILNAVQACHSAGFCHRDIKMENIMLNKDFDIKLCDFGFATNIEGKNKDGLLFTPCGTEIYKAPELFLSMAYNGMKADVFSLGVTLFALVSAKLPFEKATRSSNAYRLIMAKCWNRYWNKMEKVFPNGEVSNEFKDLFQRMVAFNPDERPLIEEIISHPWFQLQTATKEELIEELRQRETLIQPEEIDATSTNETKDETIYKGDGQKEEYFTKNHKEYRNRFMFKKENCIIIKGNKSPCDFLTNFGNAIEQSQKVSIRSHKNKLKLTVEFEREEKEQEEDEEDIKLPEIAGAEIEEEEEEDNLKIAIRYNIEEKGNIQFINFEKKGGNKLDFIRKVNELKILAKNL